MVRMLIIMLLTVFMVSPEDSFALEATITVEVLQNKETNKLEGIITIKKDGSELINSSSFVLNNNPLAVNFLDEKVVKEKEKNYYISHYSFTLPPQPKGLYLLPSISVKIGEQKFSSFPITYEVAKSQAGTILRLETVIEPSTPVYPGQKIIFAYKYIYNRSFNLTFEQLPLLDPKGFQKIGEKEIKDFIENGMNVQSFSQKVKVLKPGKFEFPASIIEGQPYRIEDGKPVFEENKIKSQTPPVTITVLEFPEEGKPASFNGSLGIYSISTKLLTKGEIIAGNEIKLVIVISGTGELDTIEPPELACQPGFSGFFRISNIPPSVEVSKNSKSFTMEIIPLSGEIKSIPEIEFSSFDPTTERYFTVHSAAIPITVKELEKPLPEQRKLEQPTKAVSYTNPWRKEWNAEQVIPTNKLGYSFSMWNVLWIIPIGLLILSAQYYWKQRW